MASVVYVITTIMAIKLLKELIRSQKRLFQYLEPNMVSMEIIL